MDPTRASDERSAALELATLLKTLRQQAGLSQQMLADKALVSVQAVSALERGYRKVPYPKTLERLADALSLAPEARAALEESARRARGMRLQEQDVTPSHNLPRRLTSFLGRESVVKEITSLVKSAPVVSVVGTGGVGKTRVSIEVANLLLGDFPDGVWFVELAPLGDPELVAHALASALGLQESPRTPLLDTLLAYLANRQVLVVIDNCEHVIEQARRVVGSLLRELPKVKFLTTSREALTIVGERVYRLPSLAFPEHNRISPEEALTFGAVALFVDRVSAADARFTVTKDNVGPIVEICRRLEGLPLAIELAAARATVLSPRQISERLDSIFDLLVPSDHAALPRHQTMRAVIEWSYVLLSTQARLLLDRLSIFASGFSLEAAADVCTDVRLPEGDVLQLLSTLIAQSMVMVDFSRGEARYHMLEATRQYAMERLIAAGELEAIARRHARSCLRVAQRLDKDWYGADERTWFADAASELDNCRAALDWSLAQGHDVETGALIAGSLERVWYSLAAVEGRNWVRTALAALDGSGPPATKRLLYTADAELCGALGEYAASFAAAQHALDVAEPEDGLQLARARQAAGSALGALGRADEAQELLNEALEDARRLDVRRLQALALGDLGTVRYRRGDVVGARLFYDEALTYYIALNLERPAASIAGSLAEIEFASGDVPAALHRAEEARVGHEAWHNPRSVANDLCNMAAYLVAMDCFDDALVHASEALAIARDVKATVLTAYVLQHFAAIGALEKYSETRRQTSNRERAAMLLGFVDARLAALQAGREYTEQQEYARILAALREDLGEKLDAVMALGAELTEDGATSVALEL
ncbi:MAG TPA: helix-turn-helix domain-containing protein [Candidatus Cybelea sp.]|nr:helix-turn-helix domain-containing protein [Candidatus Cybelea sp.]